MLPLLQVNTSVSNQQHDNTYRTYQYNALKADESITRTQFMANWIIN